MSAIFWNVLFLVAGVDLSGLDECSATIAVSGGPGLAALENAEARYFDRNQAGLKSH